MGASDWLVRGDGVAPQDGPALSGVLVNSFRTQTSPDLPARVAKGQTKETCSSHSFLSADSHLHPIVAIFSRSRHATDSCLPDFRKGN